MLEIKNRQVIRIEDHSAELIQRMLLTYESGYKLSIVRGVGTYGYHHGLFEIAILDPIGEFHRLKGWEDDVLGWLTQEEVLKYVDIVGHL